MTLEAKLGIAPIAWSNDDLPELGGETTLETCLSDARAAGFTGVETGGKFPRSAEALSRVLKTFDLSLVSGWYSGTVLDNNFESECARARSQIDLFLNVGAACLVYGETAGTIQNVRHAALDTRRRLSDDALRRYAQKLNRFAEFCRGEGLPLAFHHHMGTVIETQRELELLLDETSDAVGLTLDSGHLAFAGGDAVDIAARYPTRIAHVHVKDIRAEVVAGLDRGRQSFLDAVLQGAFTVPGDGALDFARLAKRLADIGYEGWFVVEAEQDPALAPPAHFARIGFDAMRTALEAAGYELKA
ncbi:MAG: myo-inosose-2 dehydratase [Pseudomonadota bacterium]